MDATSEALKARMPKAVIKGLFRKWKSLDQAKRNLADWPDDHVQPDILSKTPDNMTCTNQELSLEPIFLRERAEWCINCYTH